MNYLKGWIEKMLINLGSMEVRELIDSEENKELYHQLNPENVRRVLKRKDRYG